jgi:N-acetylglucosamine-6-sulfatase
MPLLPQPEPSQLVAFLRRHARMFTRRTVDARSQSAARWRWDSRLHSGFVTPKVRSTGHSRYSYSAGRGARALYSRSTLSRVVPSRRALRAAIVPVLVLAGSCSSSGERPRATVSTTRPNIVFILTDDLDVSEVAAMPNVRKLLAAEGVDFQRFYVSVSLCCPSRVTTLRGQYAHNTAVKTNGPSNGGFEKAHALGLERSTVGTWLHATGYRTAYIGKYLNGYPYTVSKTYVPPGWDEWDSASLGGSPYEEYGYTLNENGRLKKYGHAAADYGTDVYVGKANNFIRASAHAGKPFFLYLNVYAPHQPATPAPADLKRFPDASVPRTPSFDEADVSTKPEWIRRLPRLSSRAKELDDELYRNRLRSLQAVDRGVASLIKELDRSGQLTNTYVVFSSDNGFHIGQHRMFPGKTTAYETDIRVPLIVRGPGIPEGVTSTALVGNTDLAPTFAELAHTPVPDFVDGRSFAALFRNPTTSWPRRAFLVEHWPLDQRRHSKPGSAAPLEPPDNRAEAHAASTPTPIGATPAFEGERTNRYAYVEYATGERELYDVNADPEELRNLAGSKAEQPLLDAFHAHLEQLTICRASQCHAVEDKPAPG